MAPDQVRASVEPGTGIESLWVGPRLVFRSGKGGSGGAAHDVPLSGGRPATLTFDRVKGPVLVVAGLEVVPATSTTAAPQRASARLIASWLAAATTVPTVISALRLAHPSDALLGFAFAGVATVAMYFVRTSPKVPASRVTLFSILLVVLSVAYLPLMVLRDVGARPLARLFSERRVGDCALAKQRLYVRTSQAIFDLEDAGGAPVCVNEHLRDRPLMVLDGVVHYAGADGLHAVQRSGYARVSGVWRPIDDESSAVRPLPYCDSPTGLTLIASPAPGDDALVYACDSYEREFRATWLPSPIAAHFLAVAPHKDILTWVKDGSGAKKLVVRDVLGAAHDVTGVPALDGVALAARTDGDAFIVAVAPARTAGTLFRIEAAGAAHELGRYPVSQTFSSHWMRTGT